MPAPGECIPCNLRCDVADLVAEALDHLVHHVQQLGDGDCLLYDGVFDMGFAVWCFYQVVDPPLGWFLRAGAVLDVARLWQVGAAV